MIKQQCKQCSKTFVITSSDQQFYNQMSVPVPQICSACRMQRRLAWRNERTFYKGGCAKCKKHIVSQFSPEEGLLVYCETCYWNDSWSGQDYARDFDFTRTFGEQFNDLNRAVPHMAMIHTESQNCEYTHLAANNKDCYMIIESSNNEQCSYCYWIQRSTNCMDTSFTDGGQLLYETDSATNCYKVFYSQNVSDCMESYFLRNCRNVKNSFGCVNISNKQFYILNEPHTESEYTRYIENLQLNTWSGTQQAKKIFENFSIKQPRQYAEIRSSENVTGNYLQHANNCREVFHGYDVDNAAYAEHVWRNAKDVMDISTVGINAELVYDSLNCALDVYNIRFSNQCWHNCTNVDYSMYCGSLKDGFGCAGIKSGSLLIFNKSYGQAEYQTMKNQIIEHMKQTGEWGQFLHPRYSPFGYNESAANEMFPSDKTAVTALEYTWRTQLPYTTGKETIKAIPDDIIEVADTIINEILACTDCARNYRITKQELEQYRLLQIPIPQFCPDCRHQQRMSSRNPSQLWQRQCMCTQPDHSHQGRCLEEFETTYNPDRKELVYCENCYQKEIV